MRDGALLPGEDRRSLALDDAVHWVAVYEELTEFVRSMSVHAVVLARYQGGLDYWRGHWTELSADPTPAHQTADEQG